MINKGTGKIHIHEKDTGRVKKSRNEAGLCCMFHMMFAHFGMYSLSFLFILSRVPLAFSLSLCVYEYFMSYTIANERIFTHMPSPPHTNGTQLTSTRETKRIFQSKGNEYKNSKHSKVKHTKIFHATKKLKARGIIYKVQTQTHCMCLCVCVWWKPRSNGDEMYFYKLWLHCILGSGSCVYAILIMHFCSFRSLWQNIQFSFVLVVHTLAPYMSSGYFRFCALHGTKPFASLFFAQLLLRNGFSVG